MNTAPKVVEQQPRIPWDQESPRARFYQFVTWGFFFFVLAIVYHVLTASIVFYEVRIASATDFGPQTWEHWSLFFTNLFGESWKQKIGPWLLYLASFGVLYMRGSTFGLTLFPNPWLDPKYKWFWSRLGWSVLGIALVELVVIAAIASRLIFS